MIFSKKISINKRKENKDNMGGKRNYFCTKSKIQFKKYEDNWNSLFLQAKMKNIANT